MRSDLTGRDARVVLSQVLVPVVGSDDGAVARKEFAVKIAGSYSIAASREDVWNALNDIEVLARTIPGCQRLEQVGPDTYETTLKVGLQAVKGVYTGLVTINDLQPPHHYKVMVDGKGSNGFLKGAGSIDLVEDGAGTTLKYGGEANVGGTLATVGQRLIEGATRTMVNQSLKALSAQIQARVDAANAPAESPVAAEAAQATVQGETVRDVFGEAAALDPETAGPAAQAAAQAASSEPVAVPAPALVPAPVPSVVAAQASGATANGQTVGDVFAPAVANLASAAQETVAQAETFSAAPSFKKVVVPEHEQLKPESLVLGMAQDFVAERPWLPWVIVAFLLGVVVGRRR